jgi:hypothetical protein
MQVFTVTAEALRDDRLDAFCYAPELQSLRALLRSGEDAGKIRIRAGREFALVPRLTTEEKDALSRQRMRYIEITSVTRDGVIVMPTEGALEDLPTRGWLRVRQNDVLFAKNNSSRGTAVLVPEWFDGGLATTGFVGVRPSDEEEALILWSVFRSEAWRTQVYYLAITASQPEVREEIFQSEMLIPWPASADQTRAICESAKRVLAARERERQAADENRDILQGLLTND